jgi:site-specific recombinase XerD
MGKLQDRMIEDLKLSGYSATTRRIYVLYATRFARYFRRSPETMGERELRRYFLYLLEERKVSHGTYRQAYSALKFLYTVTLRRRFEIPCLPRRCRPRPLPEVLSGSEVRRLLEAFRSAKYRMLVMTMYGAGLRVSEACRLRPADIDARRMLIHVRLGKGKKDRFVTLSRRLLKAMRVYWRTHRPQDYFFPGRDVGPVSPESVRKAVHRAARDAGLRKRVTPHLLRHSFATHLLETGTDVTVIRSLLGHRQITTTANYSKVTNGLISRVRTPLDLLEKPEGRVLG